METGVTIMQMDAGLDTGNMLLWQALPILDTDTTASLHDKVADLGASLIVQALELASQGRLHPTPQPAEGVTYAHKIEKAEAPLDWSLPATELAARVRAFDPFPGANFSDGGEVVKVWAAQAVEGSGAPGEVLAAAGDTLIVACGSDALALTQLQRPGGRRLGAREFLAARPLAIGHRLGA